MNAKSQKALWSLEKQISSLINKIWGDKDAPSEYFMKFHVFTYSFTHQPVSNSNGKQRIQPKHMDCVCMCVSVFFRCASHLLASSPWRNAIRYDPVVILVHQIELQQSLDGKKKSKKEKEKKIAPKYCIYPPALFSIHAMAIQAVVAIASWPFDFFFLFFINIRRFKKIWRWWSESKRRDDEKSS